MGSRKDQFLDQELIHQPPGAYLNSEMAKYVDAEIIVFRMVNR